VSIGRAIDCSGKALVRIPDTGRPPFPQRTRKEWGTRECKTNLIVWATRRFRSGQPFAFALVAFSPPTLSAKNAEKDGAPSFICDLEGRVKWVGYLT
jgi:hypothetical protein